MPQTSHSSTAYVRPDAFQTTFHRYSDIIPHVYTTTLSPSITHPLHLWLTHNNLSGEENSSLWFI